MNSLIGQGGPAFAMLLALAPATMVGGFFCLGLAAVRFRVWLPLWFVGPLTVATWGPAGLFIALQNTLSALEFSAIEMRPQLAAGGLTASDQTQQMGWLLAAVVTVWTAWLAGAATLFGDPEDDWNTAKAGALTAVTLLVGLAMVVAGVLVVGAPPSPAVTLTALAPAIGLSSLRTSADADTALRQSELKWVVAIACLTALSVSTIGSVETGHARIAYTLAELQQWGGPVRVSVANTSGAEVLVAGLVTQLTAVALLAARGRDTWTFPSIRSLAGTVLTLSLLMVPVGLSLLNRTTRTQLLSVANQQLGLPPSTDMEALYVGSVEPPTHSQLDVVISGKGVVIAGVRAGDFAVGRQPSGERTWALPPGGLPGLQASIDAFQRAPQSRPLAQIHAPLPYEVVEPVLRELAAIGVTELQVIAVGGDDWGVTQLPTQLDPAPAPSAQMRSVVR